MKVFYKNRSNLLNDFITNVEYEDNLLEADIMLDWNCVLGEQKRNYELAKEYKKPSFVYAHGLMAENDHNSDIIDHLTGQNGKPMIADYHLSWGQGGKDILLDAGLDDKRIKLTGCPVLWQHHYWYKHGDEVTKPLGFRVKHIIDPNTGNKWELCREEHKQVRYDGKGQLVTFMPNHSMHYIDRTAETFNQIKDFAGIFVKAIPSHADWPDSPFKIFDGENRHNRIMFMDPQMPANLHLMHEILKKTKVLVTEVPGTVQLLAWSAGCHVVMPRYDWGVESKKSGKKSLATKADVECDPDKITETVQSILDGKIDKTKEMAEMAEYWGGISLGNPTDRMLENVRV